MAEDKEPVVDSWTDEKEIDQEEETGHVCDLAGGDEVNDEIGGVGSSMLSNIGVVLLVVVAVYLFSGDAIVLALPFGHFLGDMVQQEYPHQAITYFFCLLFILHRCNLSRRMFKALVLVAAGVAIRNISI